MATREANLADLIAASNAIIARFTDSDGVYARLTYLEGAVTGLTSA